MQIYLKTLKSSVNHYKKTIYSTTYEERLMNFYLTAPLGEFRNYFIRIGCSSLTKSICVKWFISDFDNFKKKVEKNERRRVLKVQNKFTVFVHIMLVNVYMFLSFIAVTILKHTSYTNQTKMKN